MTKSQFTKLNKAEKTAYLLEQGITCNSEMKSDELVALYPEAPKKEFKKSEDTISVFVCRDNRAKAITLKDNECPNIQVQEQDLGINWTFTHDAENDQYSLADTEYLNGDNTSIYEKIVIKKKGIEKSNNILIVEVVYA